MNSNGRVKGEVAVVTGAALGIGKACAEMLANQGATVAVTDVLVQEGNKLVNDIRIAGGSANFWHLNVADEANVKTVIYEIHAMYGKISILVNNAGISGINKPTHEVSADEWNHLMAINVNGVFFCTKHVLPHMMKNGKGSIINLSSIYGLVSAPDVPPYHASKGAVRMMSKTDALIYASHKIRVNSVHPGFIWTPMVENFVKDTGNAQVAKEALSALHPLGHLGDVDDIAYGVLYLASDESKFVTGTELVIDGGYTAH
jgi:NAD(P)-dependent dehydrogenase (short-subunit alcohol dehydrogenase family)